MPKPKPAQRLIKGRALAGANFPRFVDTFNWLVRVVESMRGDGDLNPAFGRIFIDRTNEDQPIIRFNSNGLGGGGGEAKMPPAPFDLARTFVPEGGTDLSVVMVRPWARIGGRTFDVGTGYDADDNRVAETSGPVPAIVSLEITWSDAGGPPQFSFAFHADLAALQDAEKNADKYLVPLWEFDADGQVVCDWRRVPFAAMAEFDWSDE